MGGRHGPHAISATDELLELLIDEVKGLRVDMAQIRASAGPDVPVASDEHDQPAPGDRATVRIEEPALTPPPAKPVKKATPRKAARPKTS